MQTHTVRQGGLDSRYELSKRFWTQEDLTQPIAAKDCHRDIRDTLLNRASMEVRIVRNRRVYLRFFVEARTTISGKSVYRRLKQRAVTLSVGSVAEAEAAVDAVLGFAMSLDGKHLLTNELENQPRISSESAADPKEPSSAQS
jgi:hypothetical protein